MSETVGSLPREEAKLINPVVLAFVGDAVYSLYVRTKLVLAGGGRAADFQRAASKVVSAHGQSAFLEKLLPQLKGTVVEAVVDDKTCGRVSAYIIDNE